MDKHGNGGASAEPTSTPEPAPTAARGLDLKARLDRYGEILAKGLDLAEAGLSLGLTVIGTVGAAAQQKISARLAEAATAATEQAPIAPAAAGSPPSQASTSNQPAQAPAPAYGITNRLRLVPGAPVSVSFSINNDSPLVAKQVALQVDAFVGERTGAPLPVGALAVTPGATEIAPMDFEKFVLRGAIPPETPPDVYHGSISIGAEAVRIPVRLVIELGGVAPSA